MQDMRLFDLVQRVARGNQNLFWRAAAIGAGAAEIAFFDERHLQSGLVGRHRDAEASVAAAQDQHVIAVAYHELAYRATARRSNAQELLLP
jgi:hypothetical protein